ncbi:MAG: cob(I)yrinic acid a,c-diamide adenosyltransferase [Candidatus Omnitrophica bacterium]|nr:cob(I)yrinic acid a,c-diamide adenosyltransferase [Candidatus Omnitrophota bacterium]
MTTKGITTKTGDEGYSRLFSGEKVSKDSPRLEAYGDLDELVSTLAVARGQTRNTRLREEILILQKELFVVGSELATTSVKLAKLPRRVDDAFLAQMEKRCAFLNATVPIPKGFVIPGATLASAYLDQARCIARRCERKVVALYHKKEIKNPRVIVWFNRLSDCLYLLARREEKHPVLVKDLV